MNERPQVISEVAAREDDRFGAIRVRLGDGTLATGHVSAAVVDHPSDTVSAAGEPETAQEPGSGTAGPETEPARDRGPTMIGAARTVGRAARLRADVRMLWDLIDRGFEVDGEAVLCERMTWVIYGRTTYDGELILAEYEDPEDAATVIRSVAERDLGTAMAAGNDDAPPPCAR